MYFEFALLPGDESLGGRDDLLFITNLGLVMPNPILRFHSFLGRRTCLILQNVQWLSKHRKSANIRWKLVGCSQTHPFES